MLPFQWHKIKKCDKEYKKIGLYQCYLSSGTKLRNVISDKEHIKNWIIPMLPFQWHKIKKCDKEHIKKLDYTNTIVTFPVAQN